MVIAMHKMISLTDEEVEEYIQRYKNGDRSNNFTSENYDTCYYDDHHSKYPVRVERINHGEGKFYTAELVPWIGYWKELTMSCIKFILNHNDINEIREYLMDTETIMLQIGTFPKRIIATREQAYDLLVTCNSSLTGVDWIGDESIMTLYFKG